MTALPPASSGPRPSPAGIVLARRRVLAGLALGVPAVGLLAAGCSSAVADVPDTLDGVAIRLHTDWSRKPDGPIPPAGDDGVPFETVLRGTTTPPSVSGGALVGNLPPAQSASYVNQEMRQKVRRIGATFTMTPGSDVGSLALATWTGIPFVNAHCHLVITPDHWIIGVIENANTLRVITDGPLQPLRQDGRTPYTVDVTVAGPTATLHLPDGTVATATDRQIERILGTVPCWEFYQGAGGAAAPRIVRSWAG